MDVIAHELAHSWSGNLVSNSSWEHFWLNEGWTMYLERRVCKNFQEITSLILLGSNLCALDNRVYVKFC